MKICCYNCGQKLDLTELAPFTKIPCPVCQVSIIVPKPFGNILLEEDIGTGRMARVYRAMDITLDREVAVKVLSEEFQNTDLPQSFINEARSASAINHPNIIPIYSCGEMEDQTYITMQYMDGGSLLKRIRKHGRPSTRELCKWFMEAAKGLDSASVHGVVHHNVKPSNIFLDVDGNVKVGDFGIAQILDEGRPLFENNEVSPGVTMEMSHYLSPEKITTGRQDLSGDIYNFGATMYHVACGVPPFNSDNVEENIRARFEGQITDPREHNPDLDENVAAFITSMLSVYPSERPRSYSRVVDKLEQFRKEFRQQNPGRPTSAEMGKTIATDHSIPRSSIRQSIEKEAEQRQPKSDKVITFTSDGGTVQPKTGGNTIAFLLKAIPVIVIGLTLILAIAHARHIPWYEKNIRPFIESILGKEKGPGDALDVEVN